jgi:opacity protein-like surface antigen
MKKKLLLFISATFIFLAAASAQDINGHWTGTVMDQYKVAYDFKVQGDSLTGKDTHPDGSVSDISNGRVNSDSLSFDVPIQGSMTHITGQIKGETITLHFAVQGYDMNVNLKKEQAN